MYHVLRKLSILGKVILILAAGGTTWAASSQGHSQDASDQTPAVAADAIYAEIQKSTQQPILVASQMAGDNFIRNWLVDGEQNPDRMAHRLNEIKERHGASSIFLVSEQSRRLYRSAGSPRKVPSGNSGEGWFFRVRAMKDAYEITSADAEIADGDSQILVISHRILDTQGNFIGIAGTRFGLDPLFRLIESYESRFRGNIHLVDKNGIILNGRSSMQHLRDRPGFRQLAADVLSSSTPLQTDFRLGDARIQVDSRPIPELGWHLVIERSNPDTAASSRLAFPKLDLVIGIVAAALALILLLVAINRFRQRLNNAAGIDTVTGLINRQAYLFVFQQALLEINRSGQPLSLVQLEVDLPEGIHRPGRRDRDRIMRNLAQLAQKAVRNSDPVSRWGRERLLIQLRDCPCDEAVAVAERLRLSIIAHNFGLKDPDLVITISLGVAQYQPQEAGGEFLQRVEDMLEQAKAKGCNRVEPEIPLVAA